MQNPFPNGTGDQMLRWSAGADGSGIVDGTAQAVNPFGIVAAPPQYSQGVATPSTALARRHTTRALVPTGPRAAFDPSPDSWGPFVGDETSLLQQSPNGNMAEHENVEELEELALKAKREAQAKRKQIPPFVQKLSR
jgi:heat shock transcription factor, other eukaryote